MFETSFLPVILSSGLQFWKLQFRLDFVILVNYQKLIFTMTRITASFSVLLTWNFRYGIDRLMIVWTSYLTINSTTLFCSMYSLYNTSVYSVHWWFLPPTNTIFTYLRLFPTILFFSNASSTIYTVLCSLSVNFLSNLDFCSSFVLLNSPKNW